MTRLTLRLDFPSGSWLGDVSRARPDATLRTTETVAAVEGDVTALTVTGTDRAETVEALRAHDRVDRIDIVDRTGPATRVRVVAPAPPPHVAAAREVGIPIEDPVAVTDGRATLDIVDDRSRLTAFGRRLTAEGVTVGIEASDADEEPILTDAQRDLVLAAVAAGYYDTPREYAHGPRQGARPREVDVQRDAPPGRGPGVATVRGGRVRRRGQRDKRRGGIGDESEREPDRDGHHRTVTALGT